MRRDSLLCPHCRIGRLDLRRANAIYTYGNTLICAPNTPAWQCDVCQRREFDAAAMRRIGLLVQRDVPPFNQYRPPKAAALLISRST